MRLLSLSSKVEREKMSLRKPKIGFMICTSHVEVKNELGVIYAIHGMAEIAARKLEESGVKVIRYKELIEGDVKGWRVDDFNEDAIVSNDIRANEAFDKFCKEDVDCVVMFFSAYAWASVYMQGIRRINKPILLWSGSVIEGDPATGLFALKGALDVVDIDYKAVYGNPDEKSIISEVLTFIKASMVKNILSRSKFGQWGSNPMGMFASVLNDWQWLKKFGIIAEHLECQTIEKVALKIPDEQCVEIYNNLKNRAKRLPPFENETIKKNIKFYLAHKELVKKYNLDFDGIKCFFEIADSFTCPCIGHALIWDEGYVSGCCTEPMGSLTMYIARLLTDNKTTIYQGDITQIEKATGIVRMVTSAGAPLNMANELGFDICLAPNFGEGEAEMYWTKLRGRKGIVCLARLYWVKDEFVMLIAKGNAVDTDESFVNGSGWPSGPFVTLKLDGDPIKFLDNVRHQYNHLIYADIVDELIDVCKVLKIRAIVC